MENLSSDFTLPVELLGLSDIEIENIKVNENNEIIIHVKNTKSEVDCHQCGRPTKPYGKGQTLKLRHLPILGKQTIVVITPPRGRCEDCDNNPTTTQTLSWYDRNAHYTKAYEKYVLLSLVHSTIADVSIKENLSASVIQHILDKNIREKIDWKEMKKLGLIGIDEISLKKGYKDFVTIITGRVGDKIKILSVIKGREKASIKAFFARIPKKKRKTIIAVCCDMYSGYVNAAKEALGKNVTIVIDRFHVAKLYRRSLVKIRQQELVRLKKELSTEEYQSLKLAISILVKKQEFYSKKDKQELENLFKLSPLIKAAYRLIRQLTAIFNANHRKSTATNKMNKWISKVESSEGRGFDKFIGTLKEYQDEITNYFIGRNNSGFVEGFNNKIKVMKRRCYGIFNLKHFFQRIFLDLEGYKLFNINQSVNAAT